MKKIKSKQFWEYTKKLSIQGQFGEQKVPMADFVSYVSDVVRGSELDFMQCFDKCQEDWDFTSYIGLYGMQEVVNLLADHPDMGDANWRAETIEQLEGWLKMLKGE